MSFDLMELDGEGEWWRTWQEASSELVSYLNESGESNMLLFVHTRSQSTPISIVAHRQGPRFTLSSPSGNNNMASASLDVLLNRILLKLDLNFNGLLWVTVDADGQVPLSQVVSSPVAADISMDNGYSVQEEEEEEKELSVSRPEPSQEPVPQNPIAAADAEFKHEPWWFQSPDPASLRLPAEIKPRLAHSLSIRDLAVDLERALAGNQFPPPSLFYQEYYEPIFDRETINQGLELSSLVQRCQQCLLRVLELLRLDPSVHAALLGVIQTPAGFRKPDPNTLNCYYFQLLSTFKPNSWTVEAEHHFAVSRTNIHTWDSVYLGLRPNGELMAAKTTHNAKESSFYASLAGVLTKGQPSYICAYKGAIVLRETAPHTELLLLELCWPTLGQLVDSLPSLGALSLPWCWMLCRQLLTAIRHLSKHPHERSLIHRDIKPDNLMFAQMRHDPSKHAAHQSDKEDMKLSMGHQLRLMDFSVARAAQKGKAGDGTDVGSLGWRAPEQQPKSTHTPKIDVFAAGLTIYWLLNRTHAFAGDNPKSWQHAIGTNRRKTAISPQADRLPMLTHLLDMMLQHKAPIRYDIDDCLGHPASWSPIFLRGFIGVLRTAVVASKDTGAVPCPTVKTKINTWFAGAYPRTWKIPAARPGNLAVSAAVFNTYAEPIRKQLNAALRANPLLLSNSYNSMSDDGCGLIICLRNYCTHFSDMQSVLKANGITGEVHHQHGEIFAHIDRQLPLFFFNLKNCLFGAKWDEQTRQHLVRIATSEWANLPELAAFFLTLPV